MSESELETQPGLPAPPAPKPAASYPLPASGFGLWRVGKNDEFGRLWITNDDGIQVICILPSWGLTEPDRERRQTQMGENARRIVACVNKCLNLETTDLENPENSLLLAMNATYCLVPEAEYRALQQELAELRPLPRQASLDLAKYLKTLGEYEKKDSTRAEAIGYLRAFAKSVFDKTSKVGQPGFNVAKTLTGLQAFAEETLAITEYAGAALTTELTVEALNRFDQALRNATSDAERESLEREGVAPFLAQCSLEKQEESEAQNAQI